MSLKSYIDEKYHEDVRQLRAVYAIINEVVPLFAYTYTALSGKLKFGERHDGSPAVEPAVASKIEASADTTAVTDSPTTDSEKNGGDKQEHTWPYEIKAGKPPAANRFSPSTHGMILHMLDVFHPIRRDSALISERVRPLRWKFAEQHKGAKDKLIENINASKWQVIKSISQAPDADGFLTESLSYGDDDPLTLTWYVELAARCRADVDEAAKKTELTQCKIRLLRAAKTALDRLTSDRKIALLNLTLLKDPKHYEIGHPFWRLRCRHLVLAIEGLFKATKEEDEAEQLTLFQAVISDERLSIYNLQLGLDQFEPVLHQQLAYDSINDPRFDPAQLAFSFEGILRHSVRGLTPTTIDHVFEVLANYQKREPCWRPITPILGTERGLSLFPLSVEVVNSILRSCELLNRDDIAPHYFSRFELQLRKYVSWLLVQVQRFTIETEHGRKDVAGWHSDYVIEPETIHLWQTSQVLLFLAHYASLLQRKIASDGLAAANITIKPSASIKEIPPYWEQEPLGLETGGYRVLAQINRDYIESRLENFNAEPNCSFLLYGPPGTGKTTVAEQMAVKLGWPLITITVSDFLADGAAAMEARAKLIFQILCEQGDVVILFDEIDQFLLDRNSVWYETQEDVFKFMTPGMLTKLQDLRDTGRSIFIAATNYYERIDSAIKRRGRFDAKFLLSLPDRKRRLSYVAGFISDRIKEEASQSKLTWPIDGMKNDSASKTKPHPNASNPKGAETDAIADLNDTIAKATVLYGWSDIKKLVNQIDIKSILEAATLKSAIIEAGKEIGASAAIRNYRRRFSFEKESALKSQSESDVPTEEFCSLIYLYAEVGLALSSEKDRGLIVDVESKLKSNLDDLKTGDVKNAVREYLEGGRYKPEAQEVAS